MFEALYENEMNAKNGVDSVLINGLYISVKLASLSMVFLLPGMIVYGWVNPWGLALPELQKYQDSIVLLVGSSSRATNGHHVSSNRYLIVNFNKMSSKSIWVKSETDKDLTTSEENGGFLGYTAIYFLSLFVAWLTWFPLSTYNKTLQRMQSLSRLLR